MSITNNALLFAASVRCVEVVGVAATQATATKLTNQFSRVIKSVGSGAFILPAIQSGEATEPMTLINDTGASVNLFPAVGEKTNGTLNGAVAIAAGAFAYFVPVLNSPQNYPSTLDWRGNVIT
jgi:hypothetical protein